jgi:5-methylcytosine-specific restriction endonuclease McrA
MRTDTHCVICAAELPARVSQQGRPRLYCSKDCTNAGYQRRRSTRRAVARIDTTCVTCGTKFTPPKANQTSCSRKCWLVANGLRLAEPHPERVCALPECDKVFTPKRHLDRCCGRVHGRLLTDVESFHKRRAIKRGTATRPVRLDEIAERDGNRCHICRRKIGRHVYPHPRSRSLDHLVPLTKGGEHTPENVRLACLGCNVAKGNRGGNEQLLLIG